MGKKATNIILICVVVGLWATIGYRFINNLKHESEKIQENYAATSLIIPESRDTFDLRPLRRDPFLNKLNYPKSDRISYLPKRKLRISKVKAEKPLVVVHNWPIIEYYGYIKSGSNKELALLKINGKLQRTHIGEINNSIYVKKIYKDSITLVFNKSVKTILKK
jgi:hypothetical protein